MKAEERHQLKENDLSNWLQYGLPIWLKQNGSYLLLAVALCFLGYQLWSLYERNQANARLTAWQELRDAAAADNPPAKILGVIEGSDDKQLRAQGYLDLGVLYSRLPLIPEMLPAVKLSRTEALLKSKDAYEKVLTEAGDDPLIAAKATLGLAGVEEDRGNWDDARKMYVAMADPKGKFAGTPFMALAASRLATLDDRRNAPRLVAMMPPPAPPSTSPAATSAFQLPSDIFGPNAPKASGPLVEPPTTGPASLLIGPVPPKAGPSSPAGMFPTGSPTPSTAPN